MGVTLTLIRMTAAAVDGQILLHAHKQQLWSPSFAGWGWVLLLDTERVPLSGFQINVPWQANDLQDKRDIYFILGGDDVLV